MCDKFIISRTSGYDRVIVPCKVPVLHTDLRGLVNRKTTSSRSFRTTTVDKSRDKQTMVMTMKNSFAVVLACLVLACMLKGCAWGCEWSGFGGCECNILGACGMSGAPRPGLDNKLTGYAPLGVEQFGYYFNSLAYLCESGTMAILYDCKARIPLYAATVMTGDQLNGQGTKRPNTGFNPSTQLDPHYQQNNNDYKRSDLRNLCYESRRFSSNDFVDADWYRAAGHGTAGTNQPCEDIRTPMSRGHLVAAQYGRGDLNRARATFTFTNVVPQFEEFNSGPWSRDEQEVVAWGQQNCAKHNGQPTNDTRMYIVVGAIPSTFYKTFPRRFFGGSGFSDYQSWSKRARTTYGTNTGKKEYRVNVPRYMWTAVCCKFRFQNGRGHWQDGVQSKAFYRENEPSKKKNYQGNIFTSNVPWKIKPVVVFPQEPRCKL